jgi:hypothetical protein
MSTPQQVSPEKLPHIDEPSASPPMNRLLREACTAVRRAALIHISSRYPNPKTARILIGFEI